MNFFIEFDKISIEDPTDCLRVYEDMKTTSGNMVKVSYLLSRFCLLLSNQAWLISYHLGIIAKLLPKLWKVSVNFICISPDHEQSTNKQSTVPFSLSHPTPPEKYS